MFFLQAGGFISNNPILTGTLIVLGLASALVYTVLKGQRTGILYKRNIIDLKKEKEVALLDASIRFQEEERFRLAADLHDDAGPLLATVRLYLSDEFVAKTKPEQLRAVHDAKQIIDEAIQLIRSLSHKLQPPTLKNFGLEVACTDILSKIHGSGMIRTSSSFLEYKRMPEEDEMLVFRVIQELINNILKHSGSKFIHLTQQIVGGMSSIRINHDGTGLSQSEFDLLSYTGKGLGLKNIVSRMKVIGGTIEFESDPAQSYYKVTLNIPIVAKPKADIAKMMEIEKNKPKSIFIRRSE
jgi:two-component system, NarL family, sensor kinase